MEFPREIIYYLTQDEIDLIKEENDDDDKDEKTESLTTTTITTKSNDHNCICQSSNELIIELPQEIAMKFVKEFDEESQHVTGLKRKKFKISLKSEDQQQKGKNDNFLQIIDAIPIPSETNPSSNERNTNTTNINIFDQYNKNLKLIKITQDGTFHYELDTSDTENESAMEQNNKIIQNLNTTITDNTSITSNATSLTIGKNSRNFNKQEILGNPNAIMHILDDIDDPDKTKDNHYATSVQNRPPVIIMHENSIPNDFNNGTGNEFTKFHTFAALTPISSSSSSSPLTTTTTTTTATVALSSTPEHDSNVANEIVIEGNNATISAAAAGDIESIEESMEFEAIAADEEISMEDNGHILQPLTNNSLITINNLNNLNNSNLQKQYAEVAPFQMSTGSVIDGDGGGGEGGEGGVGGGVEACPSKSTKRSTRKSSLTKNNKNINNNSKNNKTSSSIKSPANVATTATTATATTAAAVCAIKEDILNEEIRNCRIRIGAGDTTITGETYHSINWASPREATRKLLTALFSRDILATHTLTGKPSPAFRDRNLPTKRQLNPEIVDDIISIVQRKCAVDVRTVRSIITLKCADENKMLKMRIAKKERLNQSIPSNFRV